MNTHIYLQASAGGALIGLASVLLLWLNGQIAGISGIVNGAFSRNLLESGWRIAFVVGLIVGGLIYQFSTGESLIERDDYPTWMTVTAGLLVGFGTRLGSGCTSGHAVCGVSRLSVRSISATAVFIAVGMIVATLLGRMVL